MATKIGKFHQKIGHYSACIRDITTIPQGNRAMPQVFFSVEVRQQHSLQV